MKSIILLIILMIPMNSLSADIALVKIEGRVEIQTPGTNEWTTVETGTVLEPKTRISTGFDSSAVLDINGESQIVLNPLTRLRVEEAAGIGTSVRRTQLFLGSGRVRANVKKSEGINHDFTVVTPVATASIRGTEFNMTPGQLDVFQGRVHFKVGRYGFSFSRGQSSRVSVINGAPGMLSPGEQALKIRKGDISAGPDTGNQAKENQGIETGYTTIILF